MSSWRIVYSTLTLFIILGLSGTSFAHQHAAVSYPEFSDSWKFNTALTSQLKGKTSGASRSVANAASFDDSNLSPELRKFRTDFFAIKTADQLEAKLRELDTHYDSYPNDLKYVAAQLQLIRPFRAIVYKLTKLFEHRNITRTMAISIVRGVGTDLDVFLPLDNWKAGFDYLAAPSTDPSQNHQFTSIGDLQGYMSTVLYKNHGTALTRLNALLNNYRDPIVWDKQLVFGPQSFSDNVNRYRVVSRAEISRVISSIHFALHGITSVCAYNFEDILDVMKAMGKLGGIDGFKGDLTNHFILSKKQRTFTLNKFPNYLTIRDGGNGLMSASLTHLSQAVTFLGYTWNSVKAGDEEPYGSYSFLPEARIIPEGHIMDSEIDKLKEMVAGESKLHSVVTGETITVNLKNFFTHPPADLKLFWPVTYDEGPEFKSVTTTDGQVISYRNYARGRAASWDSTVYAPYLTWEGPTKDPAGALRVLNSAWGGIPLAPPLSLAVE